MPDTRPADPVEIIAHEGFTSAGGYRYQATEPTRHAGPIARLCVADRRFAETGRMTVEPVSLEPDEAADLGLWLLRNVVEHERDSDVRALLTARIDALSRELSSILDGGQ